MTEQQLEEGQLIVHEQSSTEEILGHTGGASASPHHQRPRQAALEG